MIDRIAREHRILSALLIVSALAFLAIFSTPLFLGEIYTEHDIGAIFVPLRWFYAQCLANGDSFLWIPNIYSGFYLHGEGQTGMTHPLHWALYKYLPFTAALDLEFILSYPFMFAGMVLFLRRWKLPAPAVYFGAFLYTFSGYSMSSWLWLVHIAVLAHTPWLLWCIDIVLRDDNRRKIAWALLGIVAFTASQLLVSYPQMVYVTGLIEALYVIFLFVSSAKSTFEVGFRGMFHWHKIRIPVALLSAKFLAIVCAAIQVLPTLHVVQQSTRLDTDDAFRLQQSLHPANLLCLVNPYLFQQRMYDAHGYQGLYGGTTVVALALWLVLRWRKLTVPRVPVACFAVVAFLGAVLTLGEYGGLYTWVSTLPVIEYFRGPPRHGAMFHAGLVGLAAFAIAELCGSRGRSPSHGQLFGSRGRLPSLERTRRNWEGERPREPRRGEWLPLLALPVIAAIPVVFIVIVRRMGERSAALNAIEEQFAPTLNPIIGAILMTVATAALIAAIRGWRYGVGALIALTIVDQGLYHLRHRTTDPLDAFIAAIDVPHAAPDGEPEYRIEPNWKPVYDVNGPLMKGYGMVTGLVSIEPARALRYKVDPYTLQLAGVKWMRARYGENEELNAYYEQGVTWIELPDPMPRARLVTESKLSRHADEDIRRIDYGAVALVEEAIELDGGVPGRVELVHDRPGVLALQTEAPSRQLLVTTESFHDGWTATIDDEPAVPVRVNGDFLGLIVDAGTHQIVFEFDPWSWRWGKKLSVIGCIAALLLFAMMRFWPTRKN